MANKPYRYHMAANIYNPQMRDELKAQYTRFEVLQGKISAIISDSDIQHFQDGSSTWYSAYSLVAQTVTSLNAQFSEFKADYDEDYSNIESKVAEYKASVDGFSATLSHVKDDPEHYLSGYADFKADVSGIGGRVSKVERTIENDVATTAWTEEQLNIKEGDITASVAKLYISGVTVQYAVGDSASTAPTSGWSASTPQWTAGKYIWQRTAITKNGQTTYSNTTCIQGATGATGGTGPAGSDGYTVLLSNESHTFAGSATAAIAASTTCDVIAYKGTTRVAATIGTITGAPNGMTTSVSSNGSTTAKLTVNVTTSMVTKQGTLTIPITVDGKSFTRNFSYSLALAGGTGADAYTIILTNESYTFPGTDTHAIADSVTSEIYAYKGTTRVAASIGTISGKPTGMSTSISGSGTTSAKFTVSVTTDMVSKSGTLSIPLTIDGKSFTKQFSYTLALAGTDGQPGSPGAAAIVYDVSLDNYSVVKKANGTLRPGTIVATAYSKTGSASPIVYATYWRIEYTKNGTDWISYATYSNYNSININVNSIYTESSKEATALRLSIFADSNRTVLLDRQTVPIVVDGIDGQNVSVYEIILSNAVVIKDATDAYSPSTISVRSYKRTGTSSPTSYSVYWSIEYSVNGVDWTKYTDVSSKASNYSFSPTSTIGTKSVIALKVSAYDNSDRTILLDSQTIPVVMDGKPGGKGVGVASIKQQWYLSTSNQTQTGGKWEDTPPAYIKDRYYWQKSVITYTDGTTGESIPVLDREFMDLEIRMTSAEQTITDAAIVQTVTGTNVWGKVVAHGETILEITKEGSAYKVKADYINLNGLVTANGYFRITQSGSPEITGGTFAGWTVTNGSFYYSASSETYKAIYKYSYTDQNITVSPTIRLMKHNYDSYNNAIFIDGRSKGSAGNGLFTGMYHTNGSTIRVGYDGNIEIMGYDNGNPILSPLSDPYGGLFEVIEGYLRISNKPSRMYSEGSDNAKATHAIVIRHDDILYTNPKGNNAILEKIAFREAYSGDNSVIISNGSIEAVSFNRHSDRRIKKNIVPYEGRAIDLINGLEICSFDYIRDDKHINAGIIAQNMKEYFPELVYGEESALYSIDQDGLVPYMIKALQEIDAKAHSNRNELNTIWNNLVEIAQAVTELQKKEEP